MNGAVTGSFHSASISLIQNKSSGSELLHAAFWGGAFGGVFGGIGGGLGIKWGKVLTTARHYTSQLKPNQIITGLKQAMQENVIREAPLTARKGLETRGYKPQPGERTITRERYKGQEQKSREALREQSGKGTVKFNNPVLNKTNKGLEVEFTNPAGTKIGWIEQNPKNIPNAIKAAKDSSDVGKSIEGKVGTFVNQHNEVTGFGVEIRNLTEGKRATDLDVVTKNQIIEVKKSVSAIKIKQIDRLTDANFPEFFNYERKEIILYIDKPLENLSHTASKTLEYVKSRGVIIVNSLEELKEVLR